MKPRPPVTFLVSLSSSRSRLPRERESRIAGVLAARDPIRARSRFPFDYRLAFQSVSERAKRASRVSETPLPHDRRIITAMSYCEGDPSSLKNKWREEQRAPSRLCSLLEGRKSRESTSDSLAERLTPLAHHRPLDSLQPEFPRLSSARARRSRRATFI